MKSSKESITHYSPFIRALTFAVLKSLKTRKLVYEEKYVIDTELVPKVSKKVMEYSVTKQTKTSGNFKELVAPEEIRVPKIPKQKLTLSTEKPLQKKNVWISKGKVLPEKVLQKPRLRQRPVPEKTTEQLVPPRSDFMQAPANSYGKIQPLLLDPSVSLIDCPGPGKQITVMRIGRKEITKLVLTPEEIKQILDKIAQEAHIPILEGVFRAAVDNFSVNAVVSEIIGSRFTIKKQTPYSMLNRT